MITELKMEPQEIKQKIYKTCPLCNHLHEAKHENDLYCDDWCKEIARKMIIRYKNQTIKQYIEKLKGSFEK